MTVPPDAILLSCYVWHMEEMAYNTYADNVSVYVLSFDRHIVTAVVVCHSYYNIRILKNVRVVDNNCEMLYDVMSIRATDDVHDDLDLIHLSLPLAFIHSDHYLYILRFYIKCATTCIMS